ncbi:MAG: phosphohydrolase [Thermoproteota archaeon]|nr:MAG: phosphohydrolase [Candidatus Korarchaeota archaeon]
MPIGGLDRIRALKSLARTGWLQSGVPPGEAETVADHSFESAILSLLMALECRKRGVEVDPLKAAVLALLHDLPEAVTGDVPRWSKERLSRERPGIFEELDREAVRELGMGELERFVDEFSRMESPEAVVARVAELASTWLQATAYEERGYRTEGIGKWAVEEAKRVAGLAGGEFGRALIEALATLRRNL